MRSNGSHAGLKQCQARAEGKGSSREGAVAPVSRRVPVISAPQRSAYMARNFELRCCNEGEATKAGRKWRRQAVTRCEIVYKRPGAGWARAVLYNEFMLLRSEATVIEHLILGAFLVIPLLIVTFLFSDELWQE